MNRHIEVKREADVPVELESQFILRLPQEPARVLREALQSGTVHLKDRMSIKLENDMRYGEVRVDHWLMHAKVVDLPTIVESLKTIDGKSFYKTADICQMVICKEEDDQNLTDEESPAKTKKKDPNKVDKKFLYPHGITPPMKNVRRRRFRKTLKKKYVEAPEIEKEVKRLLRIDNDAVNVKWEIISEDDDKVKGGIVIKEEVIHHGDTSLSLETSNQQSVDVAEHDIFGEAVSDSEEETNINIMELEDENSRPSADDSRLSDTNSLQGTASSSHHLVTQFSKEMFSPRGGRPSSSVKRELPDEFTRTIKTEPTYDYKSDDAYGEPQMSRADVQMRMELLEQQLGELNQRRQQQELEIANIENYALRQRFQENLDRLLNEQMDKELEIQELSALLQQM